MSATLSMLYSNNVRWTGFNRITVGKEKYKLGRFHVTIFKISHLNGQWLPNFIFVYADPFFTRKHRVLHGAFQQINWEIEKLGSLSHLEPYPSYS